MYLVSLIACFILITSCGKGFEEEDDDIRQEEIAELQYHFKLYPLNEKKAGQFKGAGAIAISDNQIWVRLKVQGSIKTEDMHAQYLHKGDSCPSMDDDLNQDGYLDFRESHAIVGDILIPLDGSLTTQMKGLNEFPKMKSSKIYYYSESANYTWLMDDLLRVDIFPNDMMMKLGANQEIDFDRRVVLIYGIDNDRALPNTVASFEGYPSQATLPIACGKVEVGVADDFSDYSGPKTGPE